MMEWLKSWISISDGGEDNAWIEKALHIKEHVESYHSYFP
jgi:hypothetical protein